MKKRYLMLLIASYFVFSLFNSATAYPENKAVIPAGSQNHSAAGAGQIETDKSGMWVEEAISYSAIFFPYSKGENKNIFNAGVAAKYIDGKVLAPGEEFSFNKVVGERTISRGFVVGKNIWGKPDVGGGICRTSTAIFQAAGKANLEILERHPHSLPTGYAAEGNDAAVSWGVENLRFKNSGPNPLVIHTKLEETAKGGILLAEIKERKPLIKADLAVLKEPPGSCLWENIDQKRLTALAKGNRAFISSDQLGDLLGISFFTDVQKGELSVSAYTGGRLVNFKEGAKKALVGGTEWNLSDAPFRLPGDASKFWLPLEDWARIAGAEALWLNRPQPVALFNLSGTRAAGREELDPGWRVTRQIRPYGYTDLKKDLNILGRMYPQISVTTLGQSSLGRDIPLITLGNGPVEVFISGAWHGDESITAAFLARFIEEACRNPGDPAWASLLGRSTLYIAPMINPDGCEVSAHAGNLPADLAAPAAALSPPGFDLSRWRANLQGVDLNNQYPVRWEAARSKLLQNVPPRGNAGEVPLSAPESRAVHQFTLEHSFAAVFCYHSQGEILYWRAPDGIETPHMAAITDLYAGESGYAPVSSTDVSGGYRDWFAGTYRKPALTVEVGRGVNPLPPQQLDSIWNKNCPALFKCLQDLAN